MLKKLKIFERREILFCGFSWKFERWRRELTRAVFYRRFFFFNQIYEERIDE